MLTDIYFIIDLVHKLLGLYHDKKGMREARKSMILLSNYLQTWFFIDFFSCLPVGYVSLVAEAMIAFVMVASLFSAIFRTRQGVQGSAPASACQDAAMIVIRS